MYFSPILENLDKIGFCFQEADPTSDEVSKALESDGGKIIIQDIGPILSTIVLGSKFIIFASNGVWEIGGGDSDAYKATSYAIRKITNDPIASRDGAILVEAVVYYAAKNGIYSITQDKVQGFLSAESITDPSIKSFYQAIPDNKKIYIKTAYDSILKRIYFLYNSNTGDAENYHYNKIIIFDLRLGAFIPWSVYTTYPSVTSDSVWIFDVCTAAFYPLFIGFKPYFRNNVRLSSGPCFRMVCKVGHSGIGMGLPPSFLRWYPSPADGFSRRAG